MNIEVSVDPGLLPQHQGLTDEIFQKMAEELPYTDLPGFVRNIRLQLERTGTRRWPTRARLLPAFCSRFRNSH